MRDVEPFVKSTADEFERLADKAFRTWLVEMLVGLANGS